jgi:two-component system chemotaxis response regulator CheB
MPILRSGFDYSLIICVHRHKTAINSFVPALEKNKTIQVSEAENLDLIQPGRVYVAPANKHLTFSKEKKFILTDDAPENYSRPSIDVTFKSGANTFGDEMIGILLTGANSDGAEGLKVVKEAGGITIIQDPDEAEFSTMPQAALDIFQPTHIMSADKIISFIENLGLVI